MSLAAIRPEFLELPIDAIDEPALPARGSMNEDKLEDLTQSIREIGLQQPIIVARHHDRFEVVAGHRRTMACRRAGLARVPALVYPSPDNALEAIKFAENHFREELSPADEAIWFAELLERDCDGDVDTLAAFLKKRRDYVDGRLRLLLGDPEIFRALQHERITVGVAQAINRCGDQLHRRMLLDLAVKGGATVALAEAWVREWKEIHEPATRRLQDTSDGAAASPAPLNDYFRCHLCESKEHPASMRPVQIHDFCLTTTLKPALEMYRRRSDYVRIPRTLDEAITLVNELTDRFPQLLEPTGDPRR